MKNACISRTLKFDTKNSTKFFGRSWPVVFTRMVFLPINKKMLLKIELATISQEVLISTVFIRV